MNQDDLSIDETAALGRGVVLRGCVKIGANVRIGDYTVIDGDVEIGDNTSIGHHAVITGRTRIGPDNRIFSFCTIGTAPQHPEFHPDRLSGEVQIGRGNTLREYVSVHMPTTDGITSIGDDCYIMVYCDIGHDAVVGQDVKIASGCTVAGHARIGDFTYIGLHAIIHQRRHVGPYCMIGMNTPLMKDALPYSTIVQQSFTKVNRLGLERRHMAQDDIARVEAFYRQIMASSDPRMLFEAAAGDPILKPIGEFWHASEGKCYLPTFSQRAGSPDGRQ